MFFLYLLGCLYFMRFLSFSFVFFYFVANLPTRSQRFEHQLHRAVARELESTKGKLMDSHSCWRYIFRLLSISPFSELISSFSCCVLSIFHRYYFKNCWLHEKCFSKHLQAGRSPSAVLLMEGYLSDHTSKKIIWWESLSAPPNQNLFKGLAIE